MRGRGLNPSVKRTPRPARANARLNNRIVSRCEMNPRSRSMLKEKAKR